MNKTALSYLDKKQFNYHFSKCFQYVLDSCLRRSDDISDFLRNHHISE